MQKLSYQILIGFLGLFALGGCAGDNAVSAPGAPANQAQVATQGGHPDFRPGVLLGDGKHTFVESNGNRGCGFWRNASNQLLRSSGTPNLHPTQPGAPYMYLVLERQPGACPRVHPHDGNPLVVVDSAPTFAAGTYTFFVKNVKYTFS